jgi:hypothetical protein
MNATVIVRTCAHVQPLHHRSPYIHVVTKFMLYMYTVATCTTCIYVKQVCAPCTTCNVHIYMIHVCICVHMCVVRTLLVQYIYMHIYTYIHVHIMHNMYLHLIFLIQHVHVTLYQFHTLIPGTRVQ